MANVKITDLTAYTDPASTDVIPIVDLVNDQTKKVTLADIFQNFPEGTAAAPSIAFDGDSNTGIYSPGADQLAISTSGTQRLVVDSTGQIEAKSLGSASAPTWSFVDDPNTGIYSPGANQLAFATNGTGRLFIDSSGSVGIGDADPSSRGLFVTRFADDRYFAIDASSRIISRYDDNAAIENANFTNVGCTAADHGVLLRFNIGDGGVADSQGFIGYLRESDNNGYMRLSTNNQERVRIDSSGNVGVGTSSPQQLLHLRPSNGQPVIHFDRVGGAGGYSELKAGTGFTFSQDSTDIVRITDAGLVGIGETSPSYKLHVKTGQVMFQETAAASNAVLRLKGSNTSKGGAIIAQSSSNGAAPLEFYSGTAQTMQIDSSGRLLVGTSSFTGEASAVLEGSSAGGTTQAQLWLNRGSTPATDNVLGQIIFGDNNAAGRNGAMIQARADSSWASGDYPTRLVFSTNPGSPATGPTERMSIRQNGFTRISDNGSYVGSSTSSYHEITSSFGGARTLLLTNQDTTINSGTENGLHVYFRYASPDNNTQTFIACEDPTAYRMRVYSDGDVWTSDAGTLTSDATLKRDIVDATPKLADVMNLRVRNFYWEEEYHPNKQDKKLIGFIAQEFEEVFPGLVSKHKISGGKPILDENGNETGETTPEVFKKGIKEAKLVPILVKALQEAVERIETLEQRLTDAGIA